MTLSKKSSSPSASLLAIMAFACASLSSARAQGESLAPDYVMDGLWLVQDPDGHTNVRSAPSLKAKVVGKVLSGGAVFGWSPPEKDFLEMEAGGGASHYVHASRLRSVKQWKQIPVTDAKNQDRGFLRHEGFEVRVTAMPFVAAEHKITHTSENQPIIDGKTFWGADGGLPRRSLSVTVTLNGKAIEIPKADFQDLYEPNMETIVLLTPSQPAERAFVVMSNSDGAGGYSVVWAFEQGRYRGRTVMGPP
jgi:hypothetical protein